MTATAWARTLMPALAMAAAAALASGLRPTQHLAAKVAPIHLESIIPQAFGAWRVAPAISKVIRNPEVEADLRSTYDQILERTYTDARGDEIMLSIAYGGDQSSDTTQVHRPEFCYRAMGFRVESSGGELLALPDGKLEVRHLVADSGLRHEPITYWITLGSRATLPGIGRKFQQLLYGLSGEIPDGMLVRVSSIDPNDAHAFEEHRKFIEDMTSAISPNERARVAGLPPGGGGQALTLRTVQ